MLTPPVHAPKPTFTESDTMSKLKHELSVDVLTAARERTAYAFDNFNKIAVAFSGGKDSTVMLHIVMDEAIKRGRTVAVMIVDLEAQYTATIDHITKTVQDYAEHIDLHWCAFPMTLRNGVSNYEPTWLAWDPDKEETWIRPKPPEAREQYDWYVPGMEFEEFIVVWAEWYADGDSLAQFVGIRADESLNRFRTIASTKKEMYEGKSWTTRIVGNSYNIYPIYDWRTADIWRYHAAEPTRTSNHVYDLMQKAGVPISKQRLCQPYGDDQKQGLWLYHILEPETWAKLIGRVNGANSGALYVGESGNMTGYRTVAKPDGHTWKSFTHMLLASMPAATRDHYVERFQGFIKGWRGRGYDTIPDEAPKVLEDKHWAPSWRRMCRVLLRNDWWCKGLGLTQPKSAAYGVYLDVKRARKEEEARMAEIIEGVEVVDAEPADVAPLFVMDPTP